MQALSAREAATRAGVNPAMVRYFFDDRLGFLAALMDYGFEDVLKQAGPKAGASQLATLVRALHRTPWLAQLLVQTVYAGDELRAHFERSHAPGLLSLYRGLLADGQEEGVIRSDLPEDLAIAGLISLIVFPIVAADSLKALLFEDDEADLAELAVLLITRLYAKGTSNDPT